jgi:hypothetical protein
MRQLAIISVIALLSTTSVAANEGQSIYLAGRDANGTTIKAVLNDLESDAALACANCHRESGLGTSESGITVPPVSWRFLGVDQPVDKQSRFYSLQNRRPAYSTELVHRLLTTGITSRGEQANPLMPRYDVTEQQTGHLIEYLKTLFPADDPGVDGETIKIATVIDTRLAHDEQQQHVEFIQGLFEMKNAGTRGESKRKIFSSIYQEPQQQAYRKWELVVWKLPLETGLWQQELNRYYLDQPVFVVLAPLVKDNYSSMQTFCTTRKVPCLFPHRAGDFKGDYYNFVYRDSKKQKRDYLASKLRTEKNDLLFLDDSGEIGNVRAGQTDIPGVNDTMLRALTDQFDEICANDATLVLAVDKAAAHGLHQLKCPTEQRIKIKLVGETSMGYRDIVEILEKYPNPQICWVTDYRRVLKRNLREIRVRLMAKKFGISPTSNESLAKDLFAFGLLTDSMHQLAGNFSRSYLLEIIEHMLNSYPNYTYFSTVSGAPNQRAIVGPVKEFCPAEGLA